MVKPYATYGLYNGGPENYTGQVPNIDNIGTQIDVSAETIDSCSDCATAIRNTLEPQTHMSSYAGNEHDEETRLYRYQMDFDSFKDRS